MRKLILLLLLLPFFTTAQNQPAAKQELSSIEEKTKGLKKYEGYFNFYWDENTGKVWLEATFTDGWTLEQQNSEGEALSEVEALIGFMFDISERKKTEEQLLTLQKQLEEYSYKDGLTGVANRRMFDSVLATEWANAQRTLQPLSLILLDIDHFKQFNDHYGHLQGDDCLKSVGQALSRAASRPRDFVGRFGGEEFVLVLPETDEAAARHIAERCRQQVRQQRIPHERSAVSSLLTISLGVGTLVPGAHDRPLDFLNSIDKLLYQAKQRGRDRLEVARMPARSELDGAADARA